MFFSSNRFVIELPLAFVRKSRCRPIRVKGDAALGDEVSPVRPTYINEQDDDVIDQM